jgi:hypothetical protein
LGRSYKDLNFLPSQQFSRSWEQTNLLTLRWKTEIIKNKKSIIFLEKEYILVILNVSLKRKMLHREL